MLSVEKEKLERDETSRIAAIRENVQGQEFRNGGGKIPIVTGTEGIRQEEKIEKEKRVESGEGPGESDVGFGQVS